jgi:D-arabinono-1,4-lactone oxidase
LNQAPQLTPAILQKAYGGKLKTLSDLRKQYDPQDRLLNDYFHTQLL